MDGYREGRRVHGQDETSDPDNEIVDRISLLPDFQILHILSFLPMKDVCRTSVLAKRWQNLWTRVDTFNFICKDNPGDGAFQKFITFVNNSLIHSNCTHVRKFSISCEVSGVTDILSSWIRFATGKKVEELELNLERSDPNGILYPLPIHLYYNLSFQKLKIRNCVIESSHIVRWNSLKTLVIEKMVVTETMMKNVFSGCPALQEMVLRELYGGYFSIYSETLRKLILDEWKPTETFLRCQHIEAPHLKEFHVSGINNTWNLQRLDLRSLVNSSFDFNFTTDGSDIQIQKFVGILDSVRHVKKLTLGLHCVKALAVAQLKGCKSMELQCTHLTLISSISMFELPGILWLLQKSTHLETLIINMAGRASEDFIGYHTLFQPHRGETYLSKQKNMRFLTRLKNVKIVEFRGGRNSCEKFFEMELVEFILKYGKSLETINCDSGRTTGLSRSPRSSPTAKIIFS